MFANIAAETSSKIRLSMSKSFVQLGEQKVLNNRISLSSYKEEIQQCKYQKGYP